MGGLAAKRSPSPMPVLSALFTFLAGSFRSRTALQIEILALRHQLNVLQRSVKRPRLSATDRWLWAWLSRRWPERRRALVIVEADTVIGWQRKGFVCSGHGRIAMVNVEDQPWRRKYGTHSANAAYRHRRSPFYTSLSLAAYLCGTTNRDDPTECLDHVIVFNEISLRRNRQGFTDYYHRGRTH